MSQNISTAVMNRRVEPHDSLDDFPTPPWATRALMEQLHLLPETRIWEPACGRGHMVRALRENFSTVIASDVHCYGSCGFQHDFLWPVLDIFHVDWIITNPPFRLAQAFAEHAFGIAHKGVAMFVRTSFLEGQERYASLFAPFPPRLVFQFTERVPLLKGRVDKDGTTATSYCWIVWRKPYEARFGTDLRWIPPCRKRLEHASDYEKEAA